VGVNKNSRLDTLYVIDIFLISFAFQKSENFRISLCGDLFYYDKEGVQKVMPSMPSVREGINATRVSLLCAGAVAAMMPQPVLGTWSIAVALLPGMVALAQALAKEGKPPH
jgi:hypothetical protein